MLRVRHNFKVTFMAMRSARSSQIFSMSMAGTCSTKLNNKVQTLIVRMQLSM